MTHAPLLLIGAGGHALACIDVIEAQRGFRIQGLLGLPAEKGEQRLGYPVLGCDEDLPTLALPDTNALVCLGQIKSPEPRMQLFARLRELGYILPAIVAPTRSEEHTSELQSLMRISYAVFCLKKKK